MKRVSWSGVIVLAGSTMYSWFTAPRHELAVGPAAAPARVATTVPANGPESEAASIAAMRLHDWRPRSRVREALGRDLFALARPAPRHAVAVPPPASRLHGEGSEAQQAPLASFKLIGVAEDVAEDGGPEGIIRTAIIAAPGQLYIVKEGEMVAWIYRVGRMSAESVELLDTTGGVPVVLELK